MAELTGQEGEFTMNIQVTRKETGLVEDYVLTGKVINENEEQTDGSNTLDSSPRRGD
jgi:hypothetical protein